MRRSEFHDVFVVSLSAVVLEIAYLSVFTFKVHYALAFSLVSIGALGIGFGGLLVSRSWFRQRRDDLSAGAPILGSVSVPVGYFFVAMAAPSSARLPAGVGELALWLAMLACVLVPFLCVGVVLCDALGGQARRVAPLCVAKFGGAGAGVLVSLPLVDALGPPRSLLVAAALLAYAGFRAAPTAPFRAVAGSSGALSVLVLVFGASAFAPPRVDQTKLSGGYSPDRIRASRWTSAGRFDVTHGKDGARIYQDGWRVSERAAEAANEPSKRMESSLSMLPTRIIGKPRPHAIVIGLTSGAEIAALARSGAESITGVVTNSALSALLESDAFDDLRPLRESGVLSLVHDSGRSFLERLDRNVDIIWFADPDGLAGAVGVGPGAFVFGESYQHTVEALRLARSHLTDGGLLCAQIDDSGPDDHLAKTVRFVSTLRQADYLELLPDFAERVIVATDHRRVATVASSSRPLWDAQIQETIRFVESDAGHVLAYAPRSPVPKSPLRASIVLSQDAVGDWQRTMQFLTEPVLDDSPFPWRLRRFSDAWGSKVREASLRQASPLSEKTLLWVLAAGLLLTALVAASPFFRGKARRAERELAQTTVVVFCALAIGSAFAHTGLVQGLAPMFGTPRTSFTVTYAALLLWSALGSGLAGRLSGTSEQKLGVLVGVFVIGTSGVLFVAPLAVSHLAAASLPLKAATATVLTAPAGLCLGGLLPIAAVASPEGIADDESLFAQAWAAHLCSLVSGSTMAVVVACAAGEKLLVVAAPVLCAASAVALVMARERAR